LTGGEPFMLPDLDEIVAACTAVLPTTLLTNGMLWRGRRLQMLQAMPRDRLALQISLDSATPDLHDSHRGKGTWAKAVAGIHTALGEGFTVRVAATLTTDDQHEERELRSFLDALGITRENQVVRPLAHQGAADEGLELTVESLVPEVTITADGVYWHPVGADDDEQLVTRDIFPLDAAIALVRDQFRAYRMTAEASARTFPCA
ncbi:radical SAM protein, partial [Streptomyces sp. TBY4]|uniref:radical SAM protein n=1 Tax=Streptomyces sp. TBY4 TaxID=2962030 RepID=UPI0020B84A1C